MIKEVKEETGLDVENVKIISVQDRNKHNNKMLYKVIETKDNVYLMIGKSQGYMLIKENMPKGLLELINNKCKK